jgi:O-antigen/teichoic acid export membrane protein
MKSRLRRSSFNDFASTLENGILVSNPATKSEPAAAAQTSAAPLSPRRGGGLYLLASTLAQVCALIRYTLLARLLGAEQLGLAQTLVITASFFDLVSNTEGDRFLIQDRDGETEALQGFVQLVLSGRGALVALAFEVSAWPIARFYHVPQIAPALMVLGLSPLIMGFLHLDMRRAQRSNDFRQEGVAVLAAESISLLVTVVAALLLRNFTAVLYGLIARSAVMVAVSHLQARRRYRLILSRSHVRRLAFFAIPLMINGVLLFFGGQGDRVLVGSRLGLAALGHYSAILLLIFYPASVAQRYIGAVYLPMLAAKRDHATERNELSNLLGGQTLLLALAMLAGFAIVTPVASKLLYGKGFAQPVSIIALIGMLQTARFIILWPVTSALAVGNAGTVLASNIARLSALPAALAGAALIGGMPGIVAGFMFGELASMSTALFMLNRALGSRPFHGMDRLAAFILGAMCIVGWAFALSHLDVIKFVLLLGASGVVLVWLLKREAAAFNSGVEIARNWSGKLLPRRPA